jgi:hypothetical protein
MQNLAQVQFLIVNNLIHTTCVKRVLNDVI